jgi:hypothetical protein
MFRPFRLITLGLLALLVYMGFFAVPEGGGGPGAFTPRRVAALETALWQSARAGEEMAAFTNGVLFQRELHRYSWFRSAQSGLALSRGAIQFARMSTRFERALPNLTEIAAVEQAWRSPGLDPAQAARKRLDWWVSVHASTETGLARQAPALMAEEYAQWYGLDPEFLMEAAADRAVAFRMIHSKDVDLDWALITELLERSYTVLKVTLERARRAGAGS